MSNFTRYTPFGLKMFVINILDSEFNPELIQTFWTDSPTLTLPAGKVDPGGTLS